MSEVVNGKGWGVKGFDSFDGEYYTVSEGLPSLVAAEAKAKEQLQDIKKQQADAGDLQDRVYIVRPDGSERQFHG